MTDNDVEKGKFEQENGHITEIYRKATDLLKELYDIYQPSFNEGVVSAFVFSVWMIGLLLFCYIIIGGVVQIIVALIDGFAHGTDMFVVVLSILFLSCCVISCIGDCIRCCQPQPKPK